MTEKRFINDVSEILDTWFGYMGEEEPSEREIKEKDYLLIGVARSQRDAENICEKLNEQNEELISYSNFSLHDLLDKKNKEIGQLKQEIGNLEHTKDFCADVCADCERLEKENEQLKADNNRLVNETAKIIAEHQGRVLELIDKSLEKDKQYYEMSYEDYLNGRIEALKDLKKELTEH